MGAGCLESKGTEVPEIRRIEELYQRFELWLAGLLFRGVICDVD